MHKIQERADGASTGKIEVRPMMYLALSYDHRIVDGREAVTFLVRVKEVLEGPGAAHPGQYQPMSQFDPIVIGSGPGGYVCAIRQPSSA